MDNFLKQVKNTIDEFSMLKDGENVLVGLSGGADSVALLIALHKLGYNVRACHLNHCLRGDEADRDEEFCRVLCDKLGIEFTARRENIKLYADKVKKSVETAAREFRYSMFDELAGNDKTATAHTASDTVETMIFHLARGTGLTGLCGIPPVRGKIIRPLIACTREDIEQYLQNINQEFVTDSTNLTDDYTRNRIRRQIIPLLKNINPKAERAAAGLSLRLRQEEDFLEKTAKQLIERAKVSDGWNIDVFNSAHTAIKQRMLKKICQDSSVPMHEFSSKHIQALEQLIKNKNPSAKINLPDNWIAKREYNLIKIQKKTENKSCSGQILLKTLIDTPSDSFNVSVSLHKKNYVFYKTFNTFYVDCDTIDMSSCVLRSRQAGDKIRLNEKGGTKTLKKLLIEKKIPSEKRAELWVIADKYGVIAVQSIGTDISRKPSGGEILEIKFKG